ncbi:MAG: hypothetical protein SVV80_07645 [Planctomycetota bacterium]|nr:hypothetical protein [Planctomycetota bacterium]
MRPVPVKKHHRVVLVILAVVAINTLVTFRQNHITGSQANLLAEVYKRQDPALYSSDDVFAGTGDNSVYRLNLPAWQSVLASAIDIGGPDEPINALRLLGAGMLLLYLLSMYILLYRQTHSTSVATLVAVASMSIFSTSRPYWGLGPIFTVTSASLYLTVVPLLVLGFVRTHKKPAVLLVFFLVGLCGNIHFMSAANLAIVMLTAMLGLGRLKPGAWVRAAGSLTAAVVGASPAIYHYYVTFSSSGAFRLPSMSWQCLRSVLDNSGMNVLYPGVLIEALRWLPVACTLVAPVVIILCLAGRYRASNLGEWLGVLISAVFVSFCLHGLVQIVLRWFSPASGLPVLIELFEALRLAMLPLYVLLAQATVHLLRMTHRHRSWVRVTAGLLAAVYIGSSYNTRPIRHMVGDAVAGVAERNLFSRRRLRDAEQTELREVASWASRHTAEDALFISSRAEIRLYGRRSLLACPSDLPYILHLWPGRAGQWDETISAQRNILRPCQSARADADKIIEFVDRYRQRQRLSAVPTYILFPARSAPIPNDRILQIDSPDGKWGRYWRLFRIIPAKPATAPATMPATVPDTNPTTNTTTTTSKS